MKKIYSLLAALGLATASFSQAQLQLNTSQFVNKVPAKKMGFDFEKFKTTKNKKTAAVMSGWFNYAVAIDDNINSNTAELNSNYLFPDSLGYGEFGTGNFSACWVHHIADIVDPKGIPFIVSPTTDFIVTPAPQAYFLDSMSIVYGYTRNHPNPNIVDTLVVTVFHNNTAANLPGAYFTGATAANYATDTLSIKLVKYTQATNVVNATGKYTFKILLDVNDTAATNYNEKYFKLPTPFGVPVNKLLVADVQFRPGYTYTIGTHIDYDANAFFFTSYEEKGGGASGGSFPTFWDCNANSPACDWNTSYILPQDVRYNMAGTWNNYFIPSYAYTVGYGFEHHLVSFHLNAGNVAVAELEKTGVALGQNMPNPYTKESTVNFQLAKDASSALFTVTDVMGRVVSSEKVGTAQGSHTIKLGAYASGVYYYSLNVDGNVTTKKMIVE